MKVFYSVFTIEEGELNHHGLADGNTTLVEFLQSKGHGAYKGHVQEIVAGIRLSEDVVAIKHLVYEHELITPSLLTDLKLRGQKEAKAILKQRKQKKKA